MKRVTVLQRGSIILCITIILINRLTAQNSINVKLKADAPAIYSQALNTWAQSPAAKAPDNRPAIFKSVLKAQKVINTANAPATFERCFVLTLIPGSSLTNTLATLERSGVFEFVEPNYTRKLDKIRIAATNPDPDLDKQYYHQLIQTLPAWQITKGDSNIIIGVLDTGLDYDHPEFAGQTVIHPAEDINGNRRFDPWPKDSLRNGVGGDFDNIDNDNNGFIDDVIGYDFTDQPTLLGGGDYLFPDPDPFDDNRHGTLVSGIINARAENNEGGAGIAPGCKLLVLRAFSAAGIAEDDDIARAIVYAADNGVRVLNLSFGDIYPSRTMEAALQYAYNKGIVIVASAGNGTGDDLHYPSNFPGVISVSASDYNSQTGKEFLWPASSFGLRVSLCAPGNNIYTPIPRDTAGKSQYGSFGGTSCSAPMVSAAAALLLSRKDPYTNAAVNYTPEQIRALLATAADDIDAPGWDHQTGAGRLNILKTLQQPAPGNVTISSPVNDGGIRGPIVPIIGTVIEPRFEGYIIEYRRGDQDENNWIPITTTTITKQVTNDTLALWDVSNLVPGLYTLRLRTILKGCCTLENRVRIFYDTVAPQTAIVLNTNAWDAGRQVQLIIYNSDRVCTHRLRYRAINSSATDTNWKFIYADKKTRKGAYILTTDELGFGNQEYIAIHEAIGPSGASDTAVLRFNFSAENLPFTGTVTKKYRLPAGTYLSNAYNFTENENTLTVIMSRNDSTGREGNLQFFNFNDSVFVNVGKVSSPAILLPKDVYLGATAGDRYVISNVDSNWYFHTLPPEALTQKAQLSPGTRYPARLADADKDGKPEIIAKDFRDFYVFETAGGTNYQQVARLPDTARYFSSGPPKALVADFDNDNLTEIIYGTWTGAVHIFENTGDNQFQQIASLKDTLNLEKAGHFLTQGDFNGDGKPDFLVMRSSPSLRNENFEYEPRFRMIEIYTATGNNNYQVVWRQYFAHYVNDDLAAVTAANLDTDPADEIIISDFPVTYVVDYTDNKYYFRWFHYGSLQKSHVAADFDNNQVAEFSLQTLADSAEFFEFDTRYQGPTAVTNLRGSVLNENSILLEWTAVTNAESYLVWRGLSSSNQVRLIAETNNTYFSEDTLSSGTSYVYVIQSVNNTLDPQVSAFSNPVILVPHPACQLISATATGKNRLIARFSQPVTDRVADLPLFYLNGQPVANNIVAAANGANDIPFNSGRPANLIITFDSVFKSGLNELEISPQWTDALNGKIDTAARKSFFLYTPDSTAALYITHYEKTSPTGARIYWSHPLVPAPMLDLNNYEVTPIGKVIKVVPVGTDNQAIEVFFSEAILGPVGYAVTLTAKNQVGIGGQIPVSNQGQSVTFVETAADIDAVFVYPNPVRPTNLFSGCRFAGLPKVCTLRVFTATGYAVIDLKTDDCDGGLDWDLKDYQGNTVAPGVYVFEVRSPGKAPRLGQFSVQAR